MITPRRPRRRLFGLLLAGFGVLSTAHTVSADSSSPRLAAYYERKLLVCEKMAYQWQGRDTPELVAEDVVQVGVGRDASYILTSNGQLLGWQNSPSDKTQLLDQVLWFAAGRSGIFAVRTDNALWHLGRSESWFGEGDVAKPVKIAPDVSAASIGDSTDYFVTRDGALYVKGLAHRGQYGDGKLRATDTFISVAGQVSAVKAHTGHAIMLKRDGTVMGTGGNIYGPLGRHGIGDKATRWGALFSGAAAIATGSSHSLAIRADGSLWAWGRDMGLDPKKLMDGVTAAAADRSGSIALTGDGTLWQWDRDEQPRRHFRCP